MLTRTKIRSLTHASFYERGLDLYLSDKVMKMEVQEKSFVDFVSAQVKGSGTKMYHVKMQYDYARDMVVSESCDCPAYYSYDGLCKHIVAMMLQYVDQKETENREKGIFSGAMLQDPGAGRFPFPQQDSRPGRSEAYSLRRTTFSMKQLLNRKMTYKTAPLVQNGIFGQVRLEPQFVCDRKGVTVSFRVGVSQMYVLKNVNDFADRMISGEDYAYGKKLKFIHLPEAFDPRDRELVRFLLDWVRENKEKAAVQTYYSYGTGIKSASRDLPLSNGELENLLEILRGRLISAFIRLPGNELREMIEHWKQEANSASDTNWMDQPRDASTEKKTVISAPDTNWLVTGGSPERKLKIQGQEDGVLLETGRILRYPGNRYDICFDRDSRTVFLEPLEQAGPIREFQTCMEGTRDGQIYIQKEDVPVFCRDILPVLERFYDCEKVNFREQDYDVEPVAFEIYLDAPQHDIVTCRVMAVYGDRKYNIYGDKTDAGQRDLIREVQVGQIVSAYCNAYDPILASMAIANTEEQIYEILTEGVPRFQELGEVFISEALKRIRVVQTPHVTVGVSLSGDLLELSMTSEDMSREELLEILCRYDRRRKYYRLKNGEFVNVSGEGLETLVELKESFHLTDKQLHQEQIALPKYRALFLDGELKGNNTLSAVKDKAFRSLIRHMKTVEDNDFEVPKSLEGVLREYQKKGFLWLKTLKHNGFGGILADDMGLGKTIQVLAFLYSEFLEAGEEDNRRCLIVTPASLVYNWYSEVQRFVPQLSVIMIIGSSEKRQELIRTAGKREILITSYDLLKRDMECYEGVKFFCQVIDEAQFIKNHNTQAARAVKEIVADCKLALTGTPIENRLSELWSIFDYLMPGFLYPYQRFREELEIPVVQQQDQTAMARLQKMIHPFVLRRLKKDVLKDLPDKLEEEVFAVLEGEQQKLYDAHVKRLALMLDKQTEEEFRNSKIQILSELTRLRQLCCDPSLLYEDFEAGSAKKEMCVDLVRNAVSGGHKVLLFSQFTSMLEILCGQLEQEGITYYTLTGSTSKERRKELVERFQQDDTNVFCISLKAGGTGLNLTAADIVIHYDPWWNLAVQNQATDRAHRIGQQNMVTVYKLITKGTIEENIMRLQEKKRQLADQLLGGEEVGSGSFTREELLEIIGMSAG